MHIQPSHSAPAVANSDAQQIRVELDFHIVGHPLYRHRH